MAKITRHAFVLGSQKYFRGNAHLLEMCSYGEKKTPVGPKVYLDPQRKVRREHLVVSGNGRRERVKKGQQVSVVWSETNKSDVEANGLLKAFGLNAPIAASIGYNRITKANLKLYNLHISEGSLQAMLNTKADGARKYLAKEGNDGRIVSEIWVVMEAELATHFDTSASVSLEASNADLSVTATGGKEGSQTITLSAGTTFAYKLHKVKKWNRGKTRIEDMEADYWGLG